MKLIGADKLKEAMIRYGFRAPDMTVTEFVEDVLTPIEAEPVKPGHWVDYHGDPLIVDNQGYVTEGQAFCSACGGYLGGSDEYSVKGRYCPSCGAKMEGNE